MFRNLTTKFHRAIRFALGYDGVTPRYYRAYRPTVAVDSRVTFSGPTRLRLISEARYLYNNVGLVRGAINELARLAVGQGLIPQCLSQNTEWAEAAEEWFDRWSRIADAQNRMTFFDILRCAIINRLVDGDCLLVLVRTDGDFPKLRLVRAHRIKTPTKLGTKAQVYDGVELTAYGAPAAYYVEVAQNEFDRIDAVNAIHVLEHETGDEVRGISSLVATIPHLNDLREILEFEKIGVKRDSGIGGVVVTTSGLPGPDDYAIAPADNSAPLPSNIHDIYPGEIRFLKPGEEIRSFSSGRPSPTFRGFLDYLIRDVARGLGVPYEFVWANDATGPGTRAMLAQVQRRVEELQAVLERLICQRVWAWTISVAVKRGDLSEPPDDWWRVSWQKPARLTIDVGREAAANRADIESGIRTLAEDAGERGLHWQDVIEQRAREVAFAKQIAAKYGIDEKLLGLG